MIVGDIDDLEAATVRDIAARKRGAGPSSHFAGRTVAAVFEHASLRTRSAVAGAVAALGGIPVFFAGEEVGIDQRERAEDVAILLSRHHSLVSARLRSHSTFTRMAGAIEGSGVPMVNLLTDYAHPTQALADVMTVQDCFPGRPAESLKIAYVGDSNNVARSLVKAAIATGMSIVVASPEGYSFDGDDRASFEAYRRASGSASTVEFGVDPLEVVPGSDVIYTDVWVSMGQETMVEKAAAFRPYQVSEALLDRANREAIVLHCLPAHRGSEITAEVLEGPRSRVWEQAKNRLDAMVALFSMLGGRDG